jgi:pimeloyl-ACP methyl ester carboxylesterase
MEAFAAAVAGSAAALPEAAREALRAQLLANDVEALLASGNGLDRFPDRTAELADVRLPVLLYCGERDAALAQVQRAAALLPDATFVSLPDLGHMPAHVQANAIIPHVAQFLARQRGTGRPP